MKLHDDHHGFDAHIIDVVVEPVPHHDHLAADTQTRSVVVGPLPEPSQSSFGAHSGRAGPGPSVDPDQDHDVTQWQVVGVGSSPTAQSSRDTQLVAGGGGVPAAQARTGAPPNHEAPGPLVHGTQEEAFLGLMSKTLDEMEDLRIRFDNRARAVRQTIGLGDDFTSPELDFLDRLAGEFRRLEHDAELALGRTLRTHPLGLWVKATVGIGAKQGARLIAAIGDPYWRDDMFDATTGEIVRPAGPRTVSALWAYCGYHVVPAQKSHEAHTSLGGGGSSDHPDQTRPDAHTTSVGVAASRAKGSKANWNATAKMRAYLVAESCMKKTGAAGTARSPYRDVYEAGREKYAGAVHGTVCRRCGPAGKPAQPGSPLSDGHKHARALRLVAKAVLKDLWIAARDQESCGNQTTAVSGGPFVPDSLGLRGAQTWLAVGADPEEAA